MLHTDTDGAQFDGFSAPGTTSLPEVQHSESQQRPESCK
jgi:hypothetical protein